MQPSRWRFQHELLERQRNTVFPDTVRNEGRFWRNLAAGKLNKVQKIGTVLLAIFVFGSIGWIVLLSFSMSLNGPEALWYRMAKPLVYWTAVLLLIAVLFGPVFLLLRWSIKRNLRETTSEHRAPKKLK